MNTASDEIQEGERFGFGANWQSFLNSLNDERIAMAEYTLKSMLEVETLEGRTFLDVGSGSGLFSLVARRLGAKVHSFDYDPQSVYCTKQLRDTYFPEDPNWTIEEGSALDTAYLEKLGTFDIVYSWGVLHHTGEMWKALDSVAPLVADGGQLFIAIYNDQGGWSRRWKWIKRTYNRLPRGLKSLYAAVVMGPREIKMFLVSCLNGKPHHYFQNIARYSQSSLRGMSYWHDVIDWVGGYPFEVAKPEEIFDFFRHRGFMLKRLITRGNGIACNEFIFERSPKNISR